MTVRSRLVLLACAASALYAQSAPGVVGSLVPIAVTAPALVSTPAGHVTVTIADQGPDPMQLVAGVKIATATLLDATTCNETNEDESVDNAMIYQRINTHTAQQLTLYDSQVVVRMLAVFQDRNVYAKLFRGGTALASVSSILQAAFKLTPLTGVALQIAPSIYTAVLPVIHGPQDLQALAADIVPQNSGGKLASHSCRAGLVIARTSAPVKTEILVVQ